MRKRRGECTSASAGVPTEQRNLPVKHGLRRHSILSSEEANVAWRSTWRRKLRRVLPKLPDNRTSNLSATPISSSSIADLPGEKSCHRLTTKIPSGEAPSFSIAGIEKCPMPLDEDLFSLDAMISPTAMISRRPGPDHDPASGSPVQYTPDQVSCTSPSDEGMSPEPAPTVIHQKPPNVYENPLASSHEDLKSIYDEFRYSLGLLPGSRGSKSGDGLSLKSRLRRTIVE